MSNIKVEMLSIGDFDHICRTCSSDGELKSLFENIETLSMLESITQMQFSKTEELPDKICSSCYTKINECFHFINNCKIVDEGLRRCLNTNIKQMELKTNELHSTIDIKSDEEPPESPKECGNENLIDETQNPEINDNIKEINVKQSEYYILKWGSPTENQENKKFQFTVINNSSNKQELIEQEALRRLQAANRMRKCRSHIRHGTTIETTYDKNKIPIGELDERRTSETIDQRANANETVDRRVNAMDEGNRARAKLTLPHEEHNAIARRPYETPERIALRRALAREQMRKYRCKLTAEGTAEHRAQVSENIRKFRAKLHENELELQRTQARDYIRRFRVDAPDESKKQSTPLRLSEMAQTLLQSNDQLEVDVVPTPNTAEMTRFSLRPSKIPQVKKAGAHVHQQSPKFRSWKRCTESQDEVTLRLAKTALQMKRLYTLREAGEVEESALRRAKIAGQLRQYRPVLRKNKTNTGAANAN